MALSGCSVMTMRYAHLAILLWPIHCFTVIQWGLMCLATDCPNLLLRNWSGTRPSLVTDLQTNPQWFLKVINLDPFRNCVFTHSDFNRLFMIGKKSFHFFQRCKVCYLKKKVHTKNTMLSVRSHFTSFECCRIHTEQVKHYSAGFRPCSFSVTDWGSNCRCVSPSSDQNICRMSA